MTALVIRLLKVTESVQIYSIDQSRCPSRSHYISVINKSVNAEIDHVDRDNGLIIQQDVLLTCILSLVSNA